MRLLTKKREYTRSYPEQYEFFVFAVRDHFRLEGMHILHSSEEVCTFEWTSVNRFGTCNLVADVWVNGDSQIKIDVAGKEVGHFIGDPGKFNAYEKVAGQDLTAVIFLMEKAGQSK